MISVITTVYNIEKYIGECIESILAQSFTDFELIIINDCSTDNSLNIVNSYAEKDNRIRVINNEKNLGCGMGRKIGIENAKGDYTIFIDGDDYITPRFLERLYDRMKKGDCDIVVNKVFLFNENGLFENNDKFNLPSKEYITDFEKRHMMIIAVMPFLNNNLINKKLWDKVVYCDKNFCEDTQIFYKLNYFSCKTVYLEDDSETYYMYRKHEKAITVSGEQYKVRLFQALYSLDIFEFFNYEIMNDNIYKKYFNNFYIKNYVNSYYNMKSEYIEICNKKYPNEVKELEERWDKIKNNLE